MKQKLDQYVEFLSKMQLDLFFLPEIDPDEYNELSEMIGELKEFIINSKTYNNEKK